MTTEAIIYSPSNIDSCFAAAIMRANFNRLDQDTKTFPYNRGNNFFEAPEPFTVFHILGADMTPDDMNALFEANPNSVFHMYNYENSTKYPERMISGMAEDHRFKEHHYIAGDGFKISVSARVRDTYKSQDNEESKPVTEDDPIIKDYAAVLHMYMQFLPMTAEETLFLFSNINNIRQAAKGVKYLALERDLSKTQQYAEYVQDIRHLVKTNMSMAYYPGANGAGFHTPTICVSDRDAMHAMRFIHYAHDEVISYEDIRSARVYRILSENNLQWYIKRFEPRDIWSEGHLTYFRTDLQQHVS